LELEVSVLERWTPESVLVEPRAFESPHDPCPDELDIAPGDTFVLRVTDDKGGWDCRWGWGELEGVEGLQFGERLEPKTENHINMAYRVTRGGGCSGEWSGWLVLADTAESAFAAVRPDMPPSGLFGRHFTAGTTPASCGIQGVGCYDEFVVELSER
jgi:hypothetical protein